MQRKTAELDLTPSKRFHTPKVKTYTPQYAHIYFCRLQQLRPHVRKAAEVAFGGASPVLRFAKSIVEAAYRSEAECVVLIGIVFRHMTAKPSILAEYEAPSIRRLIPDPPARAVAPYPRLDDVVFMEDDHARCSLDVSALDPSQRALFATGVVLAVRGREDRRTGAFSVDAVSSAMPAPQKPLPAPASVPSASLRMVCVVSGLDVTAVSPSLELLLECLRGTFDVPDTPFAPSVVQAIVAGNVWGTPPAGTQAHTALSAHGKAQFAGALQEADRVLSLLAAILPTMVMPGANDATNYLLPQQALHRCLLPGASRNRNLARVPNPLQCTIDRRVFLGTAGQNVDDLALYDMKAAQADGDKEGKEQVYRASGEKVLDVLEMMVMTRHLAPTCPDTLGSYPFIDSDPFVMEETPHVLFAGNQKEFASRLVKLPVSPAQGSGSSMEVEGVIEGQNVRLISIPRFDETGQAVFVNLDTLECTVREFSPNMDVS